MKYVSLETMTEKGIIKEASTHKLASDQVAALIGLLVGSAATATGSSLANRWIAAKQQKRMTQDVRSNISDFSSSLDKDEDFKTKEEKEKARARLYEIARVAPHLCLNRDLTKQIIKAKLHSGLSIEDKQRLLLLQTQFNPNPETSQFMPKIAAADAGSILADAVLIKEAALGKDFKTFGALTMLPVATGIVGGAINFGLSKVKEKKTSEALNKSFLQALNMSDKDRDGLLDNKEKARQAFNTLANFAPQVALDPQAARAFMTKIVSYDQGIDTGVIKELSEITRNLSSNDLPAFGKGYVVANKITGANNAIAPAFERLNEGVADALLD
jgi:hypothetical protein